MANIRRLFQIPECYLREGLRNLIINFKDSKDGSLTLKTHVEMARMFNRTETDANYGNTFVQDVDSSS